MRKIFGIAATILVLIWLTPAMAQAQKPAPAPIPPDVTAQSRTLQYKAFWGGLPAANIVLTIDENKNNYKGTFHLQSLGLIKNLLKLKATAQSKGHVTKDKWQPQEYQSSTLNRKKEKKYFWKLDPASKIAKVPGNPGEEQRVSVEQRTNVIDPLAALLNIRTLLKQKTALAVLNGKTLPVYDGRRRYDLTISNPRVETQRISSREVDVVALDLSVKPIAGFKGSDTDLWSKTTIKAAMANDGTYVPLQIVADTPIAPAVITLASSRP